MGTSEKIAIILFNLGGPDRPEAIRPFLFNLFNDKAIIGAPQPIRWLLAKSISGKRAPVAAEIYHHLGGKSPLLEQTESQARALEKALDDLGEVKAFICMRYWHPMSAEVVREVKAFDPDRIILLPLYPQFSTTTTGSSVIDWKKSAKKAGLDKPTHTVCCYPTNGGFIEAVAVAVERKLAEAGENARILFTAHGLPKKVIEGGDPYQDHVERTVRAIVERLGRENLDWVTCYQSRVGPLEWIGPATEDEIVRAGQDGKAIVMTPVAFVSEHSETLVELDIEYAEEAKTAGVPQYLRVPTVTDAPPFIGGLADLVRNGLTKNVELDCGVGETGCGSTFGRCAKRDG